MIIPCNVSRVFNPWIGAESTGGDRGVRHKAMDVISIDPKPVDFELQRNGSALFAAFPTGQLGYALPRKKSCATACLTRRLQSVPVKSASEMRNHLAFVNVFERGLPNENDSPTGVSMGVLQFPADRRLADVKSCASRLQNLHGEAANVFWRAEMAQFVARMKAAGSEEDEIRHQAALFLRAVQIELELSHGQEAGRRG